MAYLSGQQQPLPAMLAALGLDDTPEARAILAGSEAEAAIGGTQMPPAGRPGPQSSEDPGAASSSDEMTCSICLQHTELEEIASIKGCDHTYCVKCILRWAAHRERPTCPQCKAPFDCLVTYYQLDGSLHDFPCEESVCLLKRAQFFVDHMQTVEKGKWLLSAEDGGGGWADYDSFYQELDDMDEVEAYYFSAAAGRARITLGNRRWGENGYVASGHMRARPVTRSGGKGNKAAAAGPANTAADGAGPSDEVRSAGGKGGRRRRKSAPLPPTPTPAASTAAQRGAATSSPIPMRRHSAQAAAISSSEDGPVPGSSPLGSSPGSFGVPGTGRRARRNNRRAAEDALAVL